jgi:hypothetical protein
MKIKRRSSFQLMGTKAKIMATHSSSFKIVAFKHNLSFNCCLKKKIYHIKFGKSCGGTLS